MTSFNGSISMKYVSLVVLSVQTAAHVLMLRYSRKSPQTLYLGSSAVAMCEIVKIIICVFFVFMGEGANVARTASTLFREVIMKPREVAKLAVPAVLYTVQNNLLFVALSNLDAATYQVTYQLKILTTALFSVVMLRKRIGISQWISLLVLTAGVAIVQLAQAVQQQQPDSSAAEQLDSGLSAQFIGLSAVLCACVSSGFSGVYFEKVLKGSSSSLWIRNVQLTTSSILLGIANVVISDGRQLMEGGFFQGYNKIVWAVIMLQALGGLVVAVVVKYADNILKGFAVSFSILISTFISYQWLGDIEPSSLFFLGSGLVILATFMYGIEWKSSKTAR